MKTSLIAILLSAVIFTPAAFGMGMGMQGMDMKAMQAHDKKMDSLMQKAEKTTNPGKRMKMMREHMSMMMKMRGMMGGDGKGHGMHGKDMKMGDRMDQMQEHMQMMQIMMGNMMDQQKMMMDMK